MSGNYNKSKENAEYLESEISRLEYSHWDTGLRNRIYKDFWNHVKEINELFKNTKPILKEDRERLWNRFSDICNNAKIEQNKEASEKEVISRSCYDDIMDLIDSSRVKTGFLFDEPDIKEMKRLVSLLKKAGEKLSENKYKMIAEHKQECFNEIKDVRSEHDIYWEELKRNKRQKKRGLLLQSAKELRYEL